METIITTAIYFTVIIILLAIGKTAFDELKKSINNTKDEIKALEQWQEEITKRQDLMIFEQKEKEQEKRAEQEKKSADYLLKFIEPEFQKILNNAKNSNEAVAPINYIIDQIKPIISEKAYMTIKSKSAKMLSEKTLYDLFKWENAENKDSD